MTLNYDVLIENLRDIFWAMDDHGRILYINNVCEDILGYNPKEIIGKPLFELMCPLHVYQEGSCVRLVEQMSLRDFNREPLWMLHANGETRVVLELNSKRILTEAGTMEIHGLGRDITERIALERLEKQVSLNALKALVAAVEAKDVYTQGHSLRVAKYAVEIGRALGLKEGQLADLEKASLLHDIGKIGVDDAILTKEGDLSEHEYQRIMEHPVIGAKIVSEAGFSEEIYNAVLFHHKRYDGTGYPRQTCPDAKTTFVCIISAADALDAMTSRRSYKPLMNLSQVRKEFEDNAGKQFCPRVVKALLALLFNSELFKSCVIEGDGVSAQ